jgi:hypothetical protein
MIYHDNMSVVKTVKAEVVICHFIIPSSSNLEVLGPGSLELEKDYCTRSPRSEFFGILFSNFMNVS